MYPSRTGMIQPRIKRQEFHPQQLGGERERERDIDPSHYRPAGERRPALLPPSPPPPGNQLTLSNPLGHRRNELTEESRSSQTTTDMPGRNQTTRRAHPSFPFIFSSHDFSCECRLPPSNHNMYTSRPAPLEGSLSEPADVTSSRVPST